ncbi:hypothetical protein [Dysgonomonas sp. HGC4]|uniref:hypothetical protein n=1 Tax=Dysgonomonas sp. HGC4 TaxID=1658009 RepID=UPI000680CA47|nr:hypothetical protein [Dysgonomonas sp. HGC4]MBD8349361.1 hypothetical protein [Dysgonomonas sp. HGC4]
MANINITPQELAKSAHQFRGEMLSMPVIGLKSSLDHMSLRPGIQYRQTVGEIHDDAEFGPYDPERESDGVDIKGRDLETYLGSVIRNFDPNKIVQSIYGSLTLSGESLKNVNISRLVVASMMKSLGGKLNGVLFSAIRNGAGTKSKDLFNGFDTIAQAEITATTISTAQKNLYVFDEVINRNNAKDLLKDYWRSGTDVLKSMPTKMFIPVEVKEFYEDDYQQSVGGVVYNKTFEKTFLEGSNGLCELVALPNKADAKLIQITPRTNMLVGTGNGQDLEKIEIDRFKAFLVTLSAALLFGVQYETISPEKLLIGKLATE